VFVSYGAKSNAELLLFYGFCVVKNPYDDVPLTLELPGGEVGEVTRARAACLVRFNLQLCKHAVRWKPAGLASGLIGTLRVLTADAAALATCVVDPRDAPVSSEGELLAAGALCGALAALVEQLDEGDAALRSPEGAAAASGAGEAACREAETYRLGVRATLESAGGKPGRGAPRWGEDRTRAWGSACETSPYKGMKRFSENERQKERVQKNTSFISGGHGFAPGRNGVLSHPSFPEARVRPW